MRANQVNTLIILSGRHKGERIVLPKKTIVIGREQKCHIRLASADVSRRHCSIRPTDKGMQINDLGSRNGTLVNEVLIEKQTILKPGDTIRVGPLVLKVPGQKETDPDEATESEIVDWLAEDERVGDPSPGETTIIPGRLSAADESKPKIKKPHQEFDSIAEEAADIIRRYWDSVRGPEGSEK